MVLFDDAIKCTWWIRHIWMNLMDVQKGVAVAQNITNKGCQTPKNALGPFGIPTYVLKGNTLT